MFIRNTWYVAAEPHEVEGKLLARTILGAPVVVGRVESGKLFALEDRCPHRLAPLSMGRIVGEVLQCGYHGAQFDSTGACVGVPGQAKAPDRASVRAYPLVEKHGYIWIWMGDPNLADDLSSVPSCFYRSDHPEWDGGYGHFESIRVNFNLINDNLFDITHAEFVHPESFGAEEMRIYRNAEPGETFIDRKTTYSIEEREIVFRMRALNMTEETILLGSPNPNRRRGGRNTGHPDYTPSGPSSLSARSIAASARAVAAAS